MRITLLLFTITVITQCAINDVGNQMKDFLSGRQECQKTKNSKLLKLEEQNNHAVSGPRVISSDSSETLTKLRSHMEEDMEIKRGLKEMAVESMFCGSKLNHPIFKVFSQREYSGTMLQSDIAKQANQFLNDVARTKRQVLRDNIKLNSTWKDGVFYMFNTSGSL
uniref:Uncharacterized protein n=1 Tax=Angiostrongylus cantonensis TaxID=6313 RepID=A0A0K0D3M8_ANGCA